MEIIVISTRRGTVPTIQTDARTFMRGLQQQPSRRAQFVFGDGGVKFLSQNMSYTVFARLTYIHDGNPVGEF